MNQKNYEGVQIDECPSCSSVWLDRGELSEIVERQTVQFTAHEKAMALQSVANDPSADKIYHCPRCNAEMKKFNYALHSGVIIDRCPNQHGVWLDRNELEAIQIVMEKEVDTFINSEKEAANIWEAASRKHCPSCRGRLREVNVETIQLDLCPDCTGYWCDEGELSAIIDQHLPLMESKPLSNTAIVPVEPPQKRFCPICSQVLDTRKYDYSSPIEIDHCKRGHGVWLDAGEMDKVVAWVNEAERMKESDLAHYGPLMNRIKAESLKITSDEQSKIRISRFTPINSFARLLAFQGAFK